MDGISTSKGGWTSDGDVTNYMYYSPYTRANAYTPNLACSNKNDAFTVSDTTNGNGALRYKTGLLTTDEIMLAGGKSGFSNSIYYLYTNQTSWSASPYSFTDDYAIGWHVNSLGILGYNSVNSTFGVRPSVSLAQGIVASEGNGDEATPYKITASS